LIHQVHPDERLQTSDRIILVQNLPPLLPENSEPIKAVFSQMRSKSSEVEENQKVNPNGQDLDQRSE
jgi:hypothetical protein